MTDPASTGQPISEARGRLKRIRNVFLNPPDNIDDDVETLRSSFEKQTDEMMQKLLQIEQKMFPDDLLRDEEISNILEAIEFAKGSVHTYRAVVLGDPATRASLEAVLNPVESWIDGHYQHFTGRRPGPPTELHARKPSGEFGERLQHELLVMTAHEEVFEREINRRVDAGDDPCAAAHRRCMRTVMQELSRFVDYPLEDIELTLMDLRGHVLHLIHIIEDLQVTAPEITTTIAEIRTLFDHYNVELGEPAAAS